MAKPIIKENERIILLSDLHLSSKSPISRTDDFFNAGFEKFEYILKYAHENKLTILHAGDLTHSPRDWQCLEKLIDLFTEYPVSFNTIYGQHDMYLRNKENTIISILKKTIPSFHILDNYSSIPFDFTFIYGCSWGGEIPEPEIKSMFNILVIHAPISDTKENFDTWNKTTFIDELYKTGYNLVLCGDIHKRFEFHNGKLNKASTIKVINTGCLTRREYTDYNLVHKPMFAICNLKTGETIWEKIPHIESSKVLKKNRSVTELKDVDIKGFLDYIKRPENARFINPKELISEYIKNNKVNERTIEILESVMEDGI